MAESGATNFSNAKVSGTFDAKAHGLNENFRMTSFSGLKGWGCKVPQAVLLNLLEGLQENQSDVKQQNDELQAILGTSNSSSCLSPKIGKIEDLLITYWKAFISVI